MQPRYFISVGPGGNSAMQHENDLPFSTSHNDVRIDSDQPLLVIARPQATIVILGWCHPVAARQLDLHNPDHLSAMIAMDSSKLVKSLWGSYVVLMYDDVKRVVSILRDPSGGMPCYYRCFRGEVVIASHMDILRKRKYIEYTFDDNELGRHLLFPNLRTNRTCLAQLEELPAGYQLRAGCGAIEFSQIWDPWTYGTRDAYYDDPYEAISDLRTAVVTTMKIWVSRFESPIIGLSGGLDSSIVAATAVRAGARVTGLTLVTGESAGDERYYARETAEYLGIQLEERYFSAEHTDLQSSHAAHLPRPLARSFAQSGDQAYCDVAAQAQADAFMTGAGGDNVFCFQQSVLPIVDRILYDGMGRGVSQTTAEIAEMSETSIIRCAALAMRRAWFRKPQYRWKTRPDFLARDFLLQHAEKPSHPWLDMPGKELPGKAAHIAYLAQIQNHLEGFRRENVLPMINPLMSQPIVETCLRIPTWFSCMRGENRSIARQAFAGYLPDAILHRKTKGGPDGFLQQLFHLNRKKIRNMLLGGYLAESKIIDTAAIEVAIMREGRGDHLQQFRLLELVDVEAWVSAIKMQ